MVIEEGDIILIQTENKKYIRRIVIGQSFSTHIGTIFFKDLIGQSFPLKIHNCIILKPTLEEIILHGIKRSTQIVYPKDLGYIALKLGVPQCKKMLESGSGSGASSVYFSHLIKNGNLYVYEKESKFAKLAQKNINKFGCPERVNIYEHDISEPILERDFDCAFIDVREPWLYIENIKLVLSNGAMIGFILPTMNQVIELLNTLNSGFINVEVVEIFERYYKTLPVRVRPYDRMVAHTGYLIFARYFLG